MIERNVTLNFGLSVFLSVLVVRNREMPFCWLFILQKVVSMLTLSLWL
jgi:hypothetical protein